MSKLADTTNDDPVDECIKGLQAAGTPITLQIGTGGEAFSVQLQQSLLEATSDYFRKVLREDAFIEGHTRTITFEHDDVGAWKVLVYWILHGRLPRAPKFIKSMSYFITMAKWWILGDRYNITLFQDDCMIRLLMSVQDWNIDPTHPGCKQLVDITPCDSPLMRLIAEEAAFVKLDDHEVKLDTLDGTMGFWPAFVGATIALHSSATHFCFRFGYSHGPALGLAHWSEYMVGTPPELADAIAA
jgi:hypothetical protein